MPAQFLHLLAVEATASFCAGGHFDLKAAPRPVLDLVNVDKADVYEHHRTSTSVFSATPPK